MNTTLIEVMANEIVKNVTSLGEQLGISPKEAILAMESAENTIRKSASMMEIYEEIMKSQNEGKTEDQEEQKEG